MGCRHGLDPALLGLWRRLVAAALTGPLAWEPPYATEAALEKAKRPKKKKYKNSTCMGNYAKSGIPEQVHDSEAPSDSLARSRVRSRVSNYESFELYLLFDLVMVLLFF